MGAESCERFEKEAQEKAKKVSRSQSASEINGVKVSEVSKG